ncbi:CCA tRNA nucleotidyltransferase [Candidatus Roizmanbacteria bacterium]|nr:CCA tRNA nucleotidyltransferase [Candidatus Roizmanbacteria bacterium]
MIDLPQHVKTFMRRFEKKGYRIYLVGGAVRNALLGKKVDNWDFATDATPEKILELFPDGYCNNQFGTVGVSQNIGKEKYIFEVTPFRKESDYQDFRHPKKIVWAKTVEEDLARRDLTINAIAYDGKKIIDLFDGQNDLKNKVIACVGDPDKRFSEDALRLIRTIRFASQLGFIIEEKTRLSIQKNCRLIKNISWERIRDEFLKILASDYPSEGVLFLHNTGLLSQILPELDVCFVIPQKSPKRHHIFDVGTHAIMSLKHCPSKDPITRFATLIHDIGKVKAFNKDQKTGLITFYNHEVIGTKLAEKIADRFRLSNTHKEKLVRLVKYHQFTVSEIITDKAVRRFIREVGKEYIQDMLDLRVGDRIGSGAKPTSWRLELFKKRIIEVQKEPFKITDLKINGHDVMKKLNLQPGPQIGKILKEIFDQVIDGKIKNERQTLLEKINTNL